MVLNGYSQNRYWVADAPANWNSDNWSSTSNGAPDGAGPPLFTDNARFDANGNGNCTLDLALDTVASFLVTSYTGVIEFNGNSLRATGAVTLTNGTLNDLAGGSSLTIVSTGQTTRFNGTTVGVRVDATSDNVDFDGSTFTEPCSFEKTGSSNDDGAGGNVFMDSVLFTHSGTGGFLLLGRTNPDTFSSFVSMDITNGGLGYLAYSSAGSYFNGNIEVGSSNSGSGVRFGSGGGTSTMASGSTITIGAIGFSVAELELRNFTQLGGTAQALTLTGSSILDIYDCSFGGNVDFTSPRIFTRGTAYAGTVSLSKTGATNDASVGGNTFAGTASLSNSGSGYFLMGNGSPDSFGLDLTFINTGTYNCYLGHNSAGSYVAGDLTLINASTGGTNSTFYLCQSTGSTLTVDGDFEANVSGSTADCRMAISENGSVIINGNATFLNAPTGTNGYVQIANNSASSISIVGVTRITNSGALSNRVCHLGNNGDVTIGDSLYLINTATATNSQIYCNHSGSSAATYLGDISLECTSTDCDGIYFGNSGGSGTLADGQSISISSGGFIGQNLLLRNFTQTGATAQVLRPTNSTTLTIYDCSFGGDATFSSPRITSRGTTYGGNLSFRKTGATNDASVGGNTVAGTTLFTNIGTAYLLWGNGSPDSFAGNVTVLDSSSNNFYLAYNSSDNYINGDLNINKVCTGGNTYTYIADAAGSSIAITGSSTIEMNSTSTNDQVYFADDGTVDLGGDLTINNNSTGTNAITYIGNTATGVATIGGNCTVTHGDVGTTKETQVGNSGNVNIAGRLDIDNTTSATSAQVYIANGTSSAVTVGGVCNATNEGSGTTRRIYFGNNGSVDFGDSLILSNSSDATNSQVYFNHTSNSINTYAGDISIESTSADNDGTYFGNSNGSGTLAAGQTISITDNGFIAENLYLRNFTQIGPTPQTLEPTGTTVFTIYDCSFGSDIVFSSPQINSRGTAYGGNLNFRKTGASDDQSAGGNTIAGTTLFTNIGSGYLLWGNGTPDSFAATVTVLDSSSRHFYLAYNSAGNYIDGDLIINKECSGSSSYTYISDVTASSLEITGSSTITVNSSSADDRIHFGNNGSVDLGGNLTIINNSSGTTTNQYVANNTASTVNIGGNLSYTDNSTGGTTRQAYLGNNGTLTVGGRLDIVNNSDASNGQVYVASGSTSSAVIGGVSNVLNAGASTTKRIYLGNSGDVIFNDSLIIENTSTADNSQVYVQHSTTSVNAYNGHILLGSNSTSCDGVYFGGSTGVGTLAAGLTISISATGFTAQNLYLRNFTQVGPTAQTLEPTDATYFYMYSSNWGGDVTFTAPRYYTYQTVYSGTTVIEKTGASDDNSAGLNYFAGNTSIEHSGSNYLRMGSENPDTFLLDLTIVNSGTGNLTLAYNLGDNYVGGDLNATQSTTGTSTQTIICDGANANLQVDGEVNLTNSSTSTTSNMYLGNSGIVSVNGDVNSVNSTDATTGQIIISNATSASVSVGGKVSLTNSGMNATNTNIYFGNSGDVSAGDSLIIRNSSNSNTSRVLCNHNATSSATYSGDILLESSDASCDGVTFGNSGGSATLADGQRVVIGPNGFISGLLYFYNFDQIGNTAQSLTATGTTDMVISGSDWDAAVDFVSPRMRTLNTRYDATASLEKTGATDDQSSGGNYFTGNTQLIHSGSSNMQFGTSLPDTFALNLSVDNTGSRNFYLANNSAGNYIGGNLSLNHTSTGTSSVSVFANNSSSSLTIDGDFSAANSSTATASIVYIGNNGDVSIGGDLTCDNIANGNSNQFYIAYETPSELSIGGVTHITNSGSGTTARVFLGYRGDLILQDSVYLLNSASANTADILVAWEDSSVVVFNEDILLEASNANADGVRFGGGGGNSSLADGQRVVVGPNGFIAGSLDFYNFDQIGNTSQSLTATGTAYIYNFRSDWDADVSLIAPRNRTDYSTYNGTLYFEKTGASDDPGAGGNVVDDTATIVNTGSDYIMWGNSAADTFRSEVIINNSSTNDGIYLAYNTAGNYVGGSITGSNTGSASSTFIYLANQTNAELTVDGNVSLINDGSGTSSQTIIGNSGDMTIGGNVFLNNSSDATNSNAYIANNTSSSVSIGGVTTILNSGNSTTSQVYAGSSGDISFGDSLYLLNSSSATNSQIYVQNSGNSSNSYAGDIVVESSNANCDGVYFGSGNGQGTMAAGQTVTIGPNGFIAGTLYFRNFTQVGATDQALTLTSTATFNNYTSNWGGNVTFIAPRMNTFSTDYTGNAYLEKTGASNDASSGDNVFQSNLEMVNSGTAYFLMGNGNPDTVLGDLTMTNTGSHHVYFGHNASENYVGGDLILSNSTTGGATYAYISNSAASSLQIDGDVTITQDASSSDPRVYFGEQGDITVNGGFSFTGTASGTNSYLYFGNNSNSVVTIGGVTRINHATTGPTTHRIYMGNAGDVTFGDSLYLSNSSIANNNQLYCQHSSASTNIYNGPIVLESTGVSSDGIYFGSSTGSGTLASGEEIVIGPAGFSAGRLYLGYLTQLGATEQNLTLTGTTTRMDVISSTWNAPVTFAAPQIYTQYSTYNSTADLEKTGASDNQSAGGNTFNNDVTFANSGTGYFMVPNNVADDYNGDVTFEKTATGLIYPSYSVTSSYSGNINFDANSAITLGGNNGRIVMDGVGAQSINDLGASTEPIFRRLTVDKASDTLTLNMPITIQTDVTFTDGIMVTDSVNIMTINDNATASDASDASFVEGYVEKIGNDAFEFPVGDSLYRPIAISGPSGNSSRFRATYIYTNPNPTYQWNAVDAPIDHVSTREYWLLDRTNGTSSVNVTLSWDVNSGGVDALSDLLVARWDGDSWANHGNGGTTGNTTTGTVVSSAPITSFSPFVLASSNANNPLPIQLLDFVAYPDGNHAELQWATASERDNDFFTLERSVNGIDFQAITTLPGAGTSSNRIDYNFTDREPYSGTSYYRLKQTDFDGAFAYSNVETVSFDEEQSEVSITSINGQVAVSVASTQNELLDISIYGMNGQLIYQQSIETGGDFQRTVIDKSSIGATGSYMVIVNGTSTQASELILLN